MDWPAVSREEISEVGVARAERSRERESERERDCKRERRRDGGNGKVNENGNGKLNNMKEGNGRSHPLDGVRKSGAIH